MAEQKPPSETISAEREELKKTPLESIFEVREELMISPTGDSKPELRPAHFLKPSLTSIKAPLLKFSSAKTTSFDVGKWPLTVDFNGWKSPQRIWKSWVDRLRPMYELTWKQAGIYDAILNSVYRIERDDVLVLAVAERWCSSTHSFVFPWGEATISLEDVMILGGFSVLGESVLTDIESLDMGSIRDCLDQAQKRAGKSVTHDVWMKLCYNCETDFEHVAFLVLWLSRFVFPDGSNLIKQREFPIAIRLARGSRIALAPAVLASIYKDLTLLKGTIIAAAKLDIRDIENGEFLALTLRAPFQLVQIWVWERFLDLRPKPNLVEFGEPRWAKWDKLKNVKNNDLRLALDFAADNFRWRPYNIFTGKERPVMIDRVLDDELKSFVRCVRVSELVGLDCIEQYLPHRVAMQFGIDQDIPGCVARCNKSPEIAWSNYSRPIVSDLNLYIPSVLFESDVSTRYLEWWKQSLVGRKDAIKGVVRKKRSPRSLKTSKKWRQSFEEVKTDMNAIMDIHLPPGFAPKLKRVKMEESCYENNDVRGLGGSVPPGFPPKLNVVTGMSTRTRSHGLKKIPGSKYTHMLMADIQWSSIPVVDIKNIPPFKRADIFSAQNAAKTVKNVEKSSGNCKLAVKLLELEARMRNLETLIATSCIKISNT